MNQKTLIGLAAAAIAAILVAVVLNHSSRPQSEGGEAAVPLAPNLRDHVNDVSRLQITGAENKLLATLERGASGWTVAQKGGYAVDVGKLRDLLLKLADAKLVEQKTANKDKYVTLGVDDVAGKDANGVLLELDGLAQPLKLIVGNTNPHGGTYVRRVGEDQSWLTSASLVVDKNPADWLRKDLVDLPAARIASITLTRADGKNARVYKDAASDANFKLADVPKGREAGAEFTLNGLASTLAGLRFDDVLANKDAPAAENALKARYVTFDGVIVDITAWEKDGKDYARFVASLDAAQADREISAAQAKVKDEYEKAVAAAAANKDAKPNDAPVKPLALTAPDKDRADQLAAFNKNVDELNARFKDWTYVLPAYKYANINKSPEDLLKSLEAKPAPDAAKKPGAAMSPVKPAPAMSPVKPAKAG